MAAYATNRPAMPPSRAVTRLISMLVLYASLYGSLKSSRMFASVQPPVDPWKAPRSTDTAGRKRNRIVYAKNGSVPIQARERRLRPDEVSGRRTSGAA
jgi:hypothetical protein